MSGARAMTARRDEKERRVAADARTGRAGGLRSRLDPRLVRFLLVGVLNTLFGYLLFALLLFVGIHYAIALLLSTVAGVFFNFRTIGRLVFGSRDDSRIVRFFGAYAVTYVLGAGGLRIAKAAGIDLYLAGATLTLGLAFVSFLLNRRYVFTDPPQGSSGEGA